MSKQEIKIEFSNDDMLRTLIEKTYFTNDQRGKINGKTNFITLDETMEEYVEQKHFVFCWNDVESCCSVPVPVAEGK